MYYQIPRSFHVRHFLAAAVAATMLAGASAGLFAAQQAGKTVVAAAVIDAAKFDNLQAALDALPESGGVVRMPPGEYRITEPLLISTKNTRLEGAGAATHLINCCRGGKPALHVRSKRRGGYLWRVQLANFRVSGDAVSAEKNTDNFISYDGKHPNPKGEKPQTGDGILAEKVDEIYLEGISADHNGRHGVNLLGCREDPRICDSIFTYNAEAGVNIVAGHDVVVNANHFEENLDALRCADSFNLCMNGNNLDDHLRHGVTIENTYGSVLSGNMIEECNGTGVILDRDCYGITLSANVIAHNAGGGIDLRDAWGCAVSANTFVLDVLNGLVIRARSGRITITGNNFCDTYIGNKHKRSGELNLARGIILEATSDICISGNVFTGLAGPAVLADDRCKRLLIVGNLCTYLNVDAKEKRPAFDLRDAEDAIVENNLLGPGD